MCFWKGKQARHPVGHDKAFCFDTVWLRCMHYIVLIGFCYSKYTIACGIVKTKWPLSCRSTTTLSTNPYTFSVCHLTIVSTFQNATTLFSFLLSVKFLAKNDAFTCDFRPLYLVTRITGVVCVIKIHGGQNYIPPLKWPLIT